MRLALRMAEEAADAGEVPVGAVLVDRRGRVFSARNGTTGAGRASAHAEHLVMDAAASAAADWRLAGSTLYTTLEPCLMCAGLVVLSRVSRLVYGAWDIRFGAFGSVTDVLEMPLLNHYPRVSGGCLAEESSRLLREFFRRSRCRGPRPV